MDNESPFSIEYDMGDTTDSPLSILQKSATQKETEAEGTIEKIKKDYQLSKPRHKLIRARIIPK